MRVAKGTQLQYLCLTRACSLRGQVYARNVMITAPPPPYAMSTNDRQTSHRGAANEAAKTGCQDSIPVHQGASILQLCARLQGMSLSPLEGFVVEVVLEDRKFHKILHI